MIQFYYSYFMRIMQSFKDKILNLDNVYSTLKDLKMGDFYASLFQ